MSKHRSNKVQVQFFIMLCYVFSTAFGASFFGVDLSAPKKVVNTGFGKISQVLQPNKEQYTNSPRGGTRLREGNINEEENGYYYPAPDRKVEQIKVKTQEPSQVNINQNSDNREEHKKDIYDGLKDPSLNPKDNNVNTGVDNDDDSILSWPETGTEYTTETSEYETTTDEPLNRIGGAPPAVVASLLG